MSTKAKELLLEVLLLKERFSDRDFATVLAVLKDGSGDAETRELLSTLRRFGASPAKRQAKPLPTSEELRGRIDQFVSELRSGTGTSGQKKLAAAAPHLTT